MATPLIHHETVLGNAVLKKCLLLANANKWARKLSQNIFNCWKVTPMRVVFILFSFRNPHLETPQKHFEGVFFWDCLEPQLIKLWKRESESYSKEGPHKTNNAESTIPKKCLYSLIFDLFIKQSPPNQGHTQSPSTALSKVTEVQLYTFDFIHSCASLVLAVQL